MTLKNPQNHSLLWSNLIEDFEPPSSSSWWAVITYLYYREHGYSNYVKCLARNYDQVRQDVYKDDRMQRYLAIDDSGERNKQKIERILDEMCHLLKSQSNPSRSLKYAGLFFTKCIIKMYSKIYINNHLFPITGALDLEMSQFKKQYLHVMKESPLVILPTHRSYMDFLFISFIMAQYELPLPTVATGDNFKTMGKIMTDYLKSTGAFLVRRTAGSRTDVEANLYYDILRAYVHSLLKGGEHPMEFFMEGTRTRVGQVLRPKTGLLSMVAEMLIDDIVDDICILPVAINYQRAIEEQLLIGENTPQINMRKPKESTTNLINAVSAIMKRQYGKVYVKFLEPFKLSEYFHQWREATGFTSIDNGDRESVLHDFTNSLASKVCLEQANNNILMPFNLITYSLLARSFMQYLLMPKILEANGCTRIGSDETIRIAFDHVVDDFRLIEQILQSTQSNFTPGWQNHLEIFKEFELDRDGIVRASEDRKYIEFNHDALTFQTMLYYCNQVTQILLPVALCLLLPRENYSSDAEHWEKYREIRSLLSYEFFSNELFMKQEFKGAQNAIVRDAKNIPNETRKIIMRHLDYFIFAYLKFLNYMLAHDTLDKDQFFNEETQLTDSPILYISKDMLKNMVSLVKDREAINVIYKDPPESKSEIKRRVRKEEVVTLKDRDRLKELIERFEEIRTFVKAVISD